MKSILVDTSILIDFLRSSKKENTIFLKLIDTKIPLKISIITHTELYAGKSLWEQSKARDNLETLLEELTIIPINTSISIQAGKMNAKLRIALLDALIAATALEENMPLATMNVKHFKKIPGLKII